MLNNLNKAELYLFIELTEINKHYGDLFLLSLFKPLTNGKKMIKSYSCNDIIKNKLFDYKYKSPNSSPSLFTLISYNTPNSSIDTIDLPKKLRRCDSLTSLIRDYNNYKHLLFTDNSYLVPDTIKKLLQIEEL